MRIAGREVYVWSPPAVSTKSPLLFFSHGYALCPRQSTFLTSALAKAGYWVIAPAHKDAWCGVRGWLKLPQVSFSRPRRWTELTYKDRADDITDIYTQLPQTSFFKDRLDLSRVGLVGFSLGGYTVLGLAGANPSWRLDDVDAVLALSPYTDPFLETIQISKLSAPVMYQGGTLDRGITPSVSRKGGAYDLSPPPKYYVEFRGAGHFAWTNLRGTHHEEIVRLSLRFLDTYLQGENQSRLQLLDAKSSSVSDVRQSP